MSASALVMFLDFIRCIICLTVSVAGRRIGILYLFESVWGIGVIWVLFKLSSFDKMDEVQL